MNKASRMLTMFGVAAVLAITAACGGGGGDMVDDSPAGRAYRYRDSLMELIANKNAILGGMSRGEIPDDESLFTESATDLAALSNMLLDGFQEEEIAPNSRALPDIWANRADFEQKVQELQDAVAAVAQTAQQGDFMRAKELAADIGTRCGNCHRPYRAPVD